MNGHLKRNEVLKNTLKDKGSKSEQVDFALNLLYLASGVLYHRLVELSSKLPEIDKRLVGVEEMQDLLRLCHWPTNTKSVKATFDSLVSEMMACAQDLHGTS
jgi:hypothetical protein